MNIKWQVSIAFLFVSAAAFSQNTTVALEDKDSTKYSVPILFDGLYLGVSTGYQNIFGGSLVNGVDVLAQDTRRVWDIPIGYRKQFIKGRYLLGIEYSFGFTDGNLMHSDDINQLEITYENNSQSGIGGLGGVLVGRKRAFLIYGYLNETSRNFEVRIVDKGKVIRQRDEQGMLKYGLGVEAHLWQGLNFRASVGALRVDFGDQITNIDVEDELDLMIGLIYQL